MRGIRRFPLLSRVGTPLRAASSSMLPCWFRERARCLRMFGEGRVLFAHGTTAIHSAKSAISTSECKKMDSQRLQTLNHSFVGFTKSNRSATRSETSGRNRQATALAHAAAAGHGDTAELLRRCVMSRSARRVPGTACWFTTAARRAARRNGPSRGRGDRCSARCAGCFLCIRPLDRRRRRCVPPEHVLLRISAGAAGRVPCAGAGSDSRSAWVVCIHYLLVLDLSYFFTLYISVHHGV